MLEIIILSLIQGITEFIPVSSSSHLIIISQYLNFQDQNLSIDVSLHIGSFIAVIVYFNKDILDFIKNKDLFLKILISSIPVIVIGFFLVQTNFIENLRNIKIIGWTTILFGVLLYASDKYKLNNDIENNFSFKTAVIIGLFQILSLIPGVSRSGITITASRFLGFKRYDSAKISFFLSIPTLGAVSIYGLSNILSSPNLSFSVMSLSSIVLSFTFSILTIKYFLQYIKKSSMSVFVVYRILLGFIILIYSYS